MIYQVEATCQSLFCRKIKNALTRLLNLISAFQNVIHNEATYLIKDDFH